jgi:hypothetical protein
MASALAAYSNELLNEPATDPTSFFKDEIHRLLAKWIGAPILLILDGIDEARLSGFDSTVIPRHLAHNVKVLLSARLQAGDEGPEGWAKRLALSDQENVSYLAVGPLPRSEIHSALVELGVPPRILTEPLVEEIFRLTIGDPLLVGLYANEIIASEPSVDDAVSTFREIKPGLDAYFERWLNFDETSPFNQADRRSMDAALAILACAHGPLESDPFLVLAKEIHGVESLSAKSILEPLRRLVVGDGSAGHGYVLSHPKFRDYLRQEHLSGEAVKKSIDGFVDWALLELKTVSASRPLSDYVAANLISHMKESGAQSSQYASLMTREWYQALDKTGRGFDGMSETVDAYLSVAARTREAPARNVAVVERVRAALCLGSLKSMGAAVPPSLVRLAVDQGLISARQVLDLVKIQPLENQIGYLEKTIHIFDDPSIVEKALTAAISAKDPSNRVAHLTNLLEIAPHEYHERIVKSLDEAIDQDATPHARARALLDRAMRRGWADLPTMHEAERLLAKIEPSSQLPIIFKLARGYIALDDNAAAAKWRQRALDIFRDLPPNLRAQLLPSLVPDCPDHDWRKEAQALLAPMAARKQSALAKTNNSPSGIDMFTLEAAAAASAVVQLVSSKPGNEMSVFGSINDELSDLISDHERLRIITTLLPLLPSRSRPSAIDQCARIAEGFPTANNRTHALLALAELSQGAQRCDIVTAAWKDARAIEDNQTRRMATAQLLNKANDRSPTSIMAIELISEGGPKYARDQAELALELIPHFLDRSLYAQVIDLAMRIEPIEQRFNFLTLKINHFPADLRESLIARLLNGLCSTKAVFWGLDVGLLAQKTGDLWTRHQLDEVLDASLSLEGWEKARLLADLVPIATRLAVAQFSDVAQEIESTLSIEDRTLLLTKFASRNSPETVEAALSSAKQVEERHVRLRAFIEIIPLLNVGGTRQLIADILDDIPALPAPQRLAVRLALTKYLDGAAQDQIFGKCLEDAHELTGEERFNGFISLVNEMPNLDDRMDAFDAALATQVGRSSIYYQVGSLGDFLLAIGDGELVVSIAEEFRTASKWWN